MVDRIKSRHERKFVYYVRPIGFYLKRLKSRPKQIRIVEEMLLPMFAGLVPEARLCAFARRHAIPTWLLKATLYEIGAKKQMDGRTGIHGWIWFIPGTEPGTLTPILKKAFGCDTIDAFMEFEFPEKEDELIGVKRLRARAPMQLGLG